MMLYNIAMNSHHLLGYQHYDRTRTDTHKHTPSPKHDTDKSTQAHIFYITLVVQFLYAFHGMLCKCCYAVHAVELIVYSKQIQNNKLRN